jgi:hypothetical protein
MTRTEVLGRKIGLYYQKYKLFEKKAADLAKS